LHAAEHVETRSGKKDKPVRVRQPDRKIDMLSLRTNTSLEYRIYSLRRLIVTYWTTMADPLSIASSLLGLTTFSYRASQSLYESVESFKSSKRAICELRDEMKSLNGVLEMLTPMVEEYEDQLTHLKLPLLRCGKACREFEETINKSVAHAGVQRTSFRDWARLHYRGGDIKDFITTLAGYKSTISIAIGAVNL
jgi:hypothetical protein